MEENRILSTDGFEKDEMVWFSYIEFGGTGNCKANIRPVLVKVLNVTENELRLDLSQLSYLVPQTYNLNISRFQDYNQLGDWARKTDINLHISKTKEECIRKFNYQIELADRNFFARYKNFMIRSKRYLV